MSIDKVSISNRKSNSVQMNNQNKPKVAFNPGEKIPSANVDYKKKLVIAGSLLAGTATAVYFLVRFLKGRGSNVNGAIKATEHICEAACQSGSTVLPKQKPPSVITQINPTVIKVDNYDTVVQTVSEEPVAPVSFKKALINGLKETFNLEVGEDSLTSILSPSEFKTLIKEYSLADFNVGNNKSEENLEFFKNVISGKFRISLHAHTNNSDGRMTAREFLIQAQRYADKVAKYLPAGEKKPPFIVALTDHDNVDGCKEIIQLIASNPEKYKNLKFVSGAEMSVKDKNHSFDLTALAINPFDKGLNDYFEKLKTARNNSASELIPIFNKLTGFKFTMEEIENMGYKDKATLKNKSGVVFMNNFKKFYIKVLEKSCQGKDSPQAQEISRIFKQGDYSNRDIPLIEDAIAAVKANGGFTAWTHPVKSFSHQNDLSWFENFLKYLKNIGVDGVEANQQYVPSHYEDIQNLDGKNDFLRKLATELDMIITGGTDAHKFNIFGHHHKIDKKPETIELFYK